MMLQMAKVNTCTTVAMALNTLLHGMSLFLLAPAIGDDHELVALTCVNNIRNDFSLSNWCSKSILSLDWETQFNQISVKSLMPFCTWHGALIIIALTLFTYHQLELHRKRAKGRKQARRHRNSSIASRHTNGSLSSRYYAQFRPFDIFHFQFWLIRAICVVYSSFE